MSLALLLDRIISSPLHLVTKKASTFDIFNFGNQSLDSKSRVLQMQGFLILNTCLVLWKQFPNQADFAS